MAEKIYIAKLYMTTGFEVFNCNSLEEAEKEANDLAINLVQCLDNEIELDLVEVEEAHP